MIVVDAMNVIGARPDGWWRDRDRALRRLVADLDLLCESLVVVADGRPVPDLAEGRHGFVELLYAGRSGPDAADDRIVEFVEALDDASTATVVTSDRRLAERIQALGAIAIGAGAFRTSLDRRSRRTSDR